MQAFRRCNHNGASAARRSRPIHPQYRRKGLGKLTGIGIKGLLTRTAKLRGMRKNGRESRRWICQEENDRFSKRIVEMRRWVGDNER